MEIRTRRETPEVRFFQSDIRKNGDAFTGLSRKERKIWKTYSPRKRQRILKKAKSYAVAPNNQEMADRQEPSAGKQRVRRPVQKRLYLESERYGMPERGDVRTGTVRRRQTIKQRYEYSDTNMRKVTGSMPGAIRNAGQARQQGSEKADAVSGYLDRNKQRQKKVIHKKSNRKQNPDIQKDRKQQTRSKKREQRRMLHYIRRTLNREQQKEDARDLEQNRSFIEETEKTARAGGYILGIPLRFLKKRAVSVKHLKESGMRTGMAVLAALGGAAFPLLLILVLMMMAGMFLASDEDTDQSVGSSNGEAIAAYAREWIGKTRYVWGAGRGGKDDWMDYADCSSFVSGVFSHFDHDIGSTTYAMEVSGGTVVATNGTDQALPGDLILFYSGSISTNASSHVAIYSGNGNMIHCSGGPENYDAAHAGRGVCESSVASDGRPYQVRRVVDSDILSAQQLLETLDGYASEIRKGNWNYGYDNAESFEEEKKGKRMLTEAQMVTWALRDMGVFDAGDGFTMQENGSISFAGGGSSKIRKYCETISCYKTVSQLKKEDTLQMGDICLYADHINVYAGDGKWYDVKKDSGKVASIGPMQKNQSEKVSQIYRLKGTAGPSGKELVKVVKAYDKEIRADIKKGKSWHASRLYGAGSFQKAIAPDGNKRLNGPRLVCWGLYDLGILEYGQTIYWSAAGKLVMNDTVKKELKESCKILEVKKSAGKLVKSGQLKAGDICFYGTKMQAAVYAGKGKCYTVPGAGSQSIRVQSLGPQALPSGIIKAIIRINEPVTTGGIGTGGHKVDGTGYTQAQQELIWAIVAQEDNGSYEGSLAVISTAMNRVDSPRWSYCGSNALQQLTAPGQFCYSIDTYWQARLGGNVPDYTKKAVEDCLKRGIRNHPYTCFRSTKGSETGANAVQIGANGNWYFGN